MKKTILIVAVILLPVLAACGTGSELQTEAVPTLVLETNSTGSSAAPVSASAEIVPALDVQLSFPLTGTVTSVEIEPGDTVAAGQTLATIDAKVLEARVSEAEANLAAAETKVRYLQRIQTYVEDLDAAQAEVDRSQAALDAAKENLKQAALISPIAGTVVTVDMAPGETVTPGFVVTIIGDLTRYKIETTDLSERDVPRVSPGHSASVYIEALNQTIGGKVVDVARQASTIGGDVVFTVTIELDEQLPGLRWGMSAEVEIEVE
ncbi:MAG: efflux RND transporter periplasmic adaptor subunit [Anaerolineales bacterium]|nr:efflux RND transporter periplasmic adaptor subunit [Anaerolineales bacterium]